MEYNTQGLYMVLAGRFASWQERVYLLKIRSGLRRAIGIWIVFAVLVFAWEFVMLLTFEKDVGVMVCASVINFISAIALIFFPISERHRDRNCFQTMWYDEQADKALLFFGCMYSLYDDRVVYTDCRCEKTLYWNDVTLCLETVYGFLLETPTAQAFIRAADLTAEQAEELRIYLIEHDQTACYRKKKALYGRSPSPLPLPVFQNDDQVLTRAQTVWQDRAFSKNNRARLRDLYLKLVLPASLICATVFSVFAAITDVYIVDLLVFCIGFAVAGGVLTALLSIKIAKKVPLSIAFTRDGVAVFANGNSYFAMNSRVRRKTTKKAVHLTFSNGKTVVIPLTQIEDAEKLNV